MFVLSEYADLTSNPTLALKCLEVVLSERCVVVVVEEDRSLLCKIRMHDDEGNGKHRYALGPVLSHQSHA